MVACDMPFVTPAVFRALLKESAGFDFVVPVDENGHTEPLCAYYARSLISPVDELIREGQFKLQHLSLLPGSKKVPVQFLGGQDLFRKINSPDEPGST